MQSFRIAGLALAILLAGCAQGPAAPNAADGTTPPVSCQASTCPSPGGGDKPSSALATESGVYHFAGMVAGASPPNIQDRQPALPAPAPVAKHDTFQVPPGAVGLTFTAVMHTGLGSGQIYVDGPDGKRAFSSGDVACVGAPAPVSTAVCLVGKDLSAGTFLPGQYTVDYCVAGALDVTFDVVASVAANATKA
jgi:hypothetical protein